MLLLVLDKFLITVNNFFYEFLTKLVNEKAFVDDYVNQKTPLLLYEEKEQS